MKSIAEIRRDFPILERKIGGNPLVYFDNGKGLDAKYKDKPEKILNVHETTREDGHGLGMWIVSNTIYKLGGEIKINPNYQGFYLSASILINESED